MIKQLRLKNFRRYKDETITFPKGMTFIQGENNAGKSSLFMAVEYALFGVIKGFRSQAPLAAPDVEKMGVEIIYEGVDNELYKLQRVHDITEKRSGKLSASGHFTLKQLTENSEKYLISSDFEGQSDDDLQLKILETLGISKRLFDVGVNIRQGEITSILDGTTELDIVLGVSAAVMADKQLRSLA